MTEDIKLPPLPDLPAYSAEVFDREINVVSETMVEQLMQDYAREAIEADRKRREAPTAEGWPEPLSEFSEGQWWVKELDALKDLPGASNDQKRAVAVVHHLLASVDRQQRGEPVARVNDEGFIVETGLGLASGTKLYTSPQPAEPSRGELVAFSYELATARSDDGEYINWSPRLSYFMPNVPDGSIRNLQWLYVAQPATINLEKKNDY